MCSHSLDPYTCQPEGKHLDASELQRRRLDCLSVALWMRMQRRRCTTEFHKKEAGEEDDLLPCYETKRRYWKVRRALQQL
jgi:hypothetical protein